MTDILRVIVKCLAAILAGTLEGNGAVYFFNKMPAVWLCDYDQKPPEELQEPYTQRMKSYPWKFLFTMLFVVINVKLVIDDWQFAVAATCAMWLLLEMSIADIKYRIVPDQLVILLAVSAVGFIPFHGRWTDCLLGSVVGFGIMMATAFLGKIFYRREALGGGDIKLFGALGLLTGLRGILAVFVMTTLFSSGHIIWLLLRRKIKPADTAPMVPYIAAAATVYMIFLWGEGEILYL